MLIPEKLLLEMLCCEAYALSDFKLSHEIDIDDIEDANQQCRTERAWKSGEPSQYIWVLNHGEHTCYGQAGLWEDRSGKLSVFDVQRHRYIDNKTYLRAGLKYLGLQTDGHTLSDYILYDYHDNILLHIPTEIIELQAQYISRLLINIYDVLDGQAPSVSGQHCQECKIRSNCYYQIEPNKLFLEPI